MTALTTLVARLDWLLVIHPPHATQATLKTLAIKMASVVILQRFTAASISDQELTSVVAYPHDQ
jgi:hypothetical protein